MARTDADGVAHAVMSMPPNSTFRVVIDTSSSRAAPAEPGHHLTVADADEIFLIDQQFQEDAPPPRAAHRPRRRPVKKKV
jgi:hypothetical protein